MKITFDLLKPILGHEGHRPVDTVGRPIRFNVGVVA